MYFAPLHVKGMKKNGVIQPRRKMRRVSRALALRSDEAMKEGVKQGHRTERRLQNVKYFSDKKYLCARSEDQGRLKCVAHGSVFGSDDVL